MASSVFEKFFLIIFFSNFGTHGRLKFPDQVNEQRVSALQSADPPTSTV
jgi:hypothetical protein